MEKLAATNGGVEGEVAMTIELSISASIHRWLEEEEEVFMQSSVSGCGAEAMILIATHKGKCFVLCICVVVVLWLFVSVCRGRGIVRFVSLLFLFWW